MPIPRDGGRAKPSCQVQIYGLADPDTREIRYVGKARDAVLRLASHLRECRVARRKTPLYAWLRLLANQQKVPLLLILEEVEHAAWQQAEVSWIARYSASGRLTNVAKGGNDIPVTHAQRVRAARLAVVARSRPGPRRRLWELKRRMAGALSMEMRRGNFSLAYFIRFRMRLLAVTVPHACWEWGAL